MIRRLIFIVMLLQAISSRCLNGCLSCDKEKNRCLACDEKSGYKNWYGRCVIKPEDNCTISDSHGHCYSCKDGYYLDQNTYMCVDHEPAEMVENCIFYAKKGKCQYCKKDFVLEGNECVEDTEKIDNCEIKGKGGVCVAWAKAVVGNCAGLRSRTLWRFAKADLAMMSR